MNWSLVYTVLCKKDLIILSNKTTSKLVWKAQLVAKKILFCSTCQVLDSKSRQKKKKRVKKNCIRFYFHFKTQDIRTVIGVSKGVNGNIVKTLLQKCKNTFSEKECNKNITNRVLSWVCWCPLKSSNFGKRCLSQKGPKQVIIVNFIFNLDSKYCKYYSRYSIL